MTASSISEQIGEVIVSVPLFSCIKFEDDSWLDLRAQGFKTNKYLIAAQQCRVKVYLRHNNKNQKTLKPNRDTNK